MRWSNDLYQFLVYSKRTQKMEAQQERSLGTPTDWEGRREMVNAVVNHHGSVAIFNL